MVALVAHMDVSVIGTIFVVLVFAVFAHRDVAWKAAVLTSGMGRAEALFNRVGVHAFCYTSLAPIAPVARNTAVGVEVHAVRHIPASYATSLTVSESWTVLKTTATGG
jgi:hypothetical protein